ncbi:2OG-Fe dioxygenase family protein [Streptomyces sp. NPDC051664]|uniref:2OG-Fe dioxygenase family protein n=1 Tax=Streptomyces sp. NPDC051664 TaxID=3365668 RepID=UPI0037B08D49
MSGTTEAAYAAELARSGYASIPSAFYFDSVLADRSRDELRSEYVQLENAFSDLTLDPYSPGNRYRRYAQLRVEKGSTDFEYGLFEPYLQTKSYNADTGGIVRSYPLISEELQKNDLLAQILRSDITCVQAYDRIEAEPSELMVGLHLFRYLAYPGNPAYSSPNWLHKDDENVVFVHLVGLSGNAIGGDSVIAPDAKHFENVLRLTDVFDTVVVNHDKLHAVTPVGASGTNTIVPSRRDILLVTFQVRSA